MELGIITNPNPLTYDGPTNVYCQIHTHTNIEYKMCKMYKPCIIGTELVIHMFYELSFLHRLCLTGTQLEFPDSRFINNV